MGIEKNFCLENVDEIVKFTLSSPLCHPYLWRFFYELLLCCIQSSTNFCFFL